MNIKASNAEEYSSDELETLKETYQEEIPDIKIKDAKKVTLKLTIEAEEIGEQSNTIDLSVIKIGKKWYMDLVNMGSIF